jgi:hypothetical protein
MLNKFPNSVFRQPEQAQDEELNGEKKERVGSNCLAAVQFEKSTLVIRSRHDMYLAVSNQNA